MAWSAQHRKCQWCFRFRVQFETVFAGQPVLAPGGGQLDLCPNCQATLETYDRGPSPSFPTFPPGPPPDRKPGPPRPPGPIGEIPVPELPPVVL